jgi:CrcB protein
LIVNLVGSFLIALVHGLALRIGDFSPELRLGLTTGFMGGLTTYSAFNYETTSMILDGRRVQGLANIGATVLGCLGAGLLGTWVAS